MQFFRPDHRPSALPTARFRRTLTLLSLGILAAVAPAIAADITPPVGGMQIKVLGGTSSAPATTRFSLPLNDTPGATGLMQGRIQSLTTNSFTVTDAGWVAGALASGAAPYDVKITSGAAAGLRFAINGNTTDTLSILGQDPTGLGIVVGGAGDTFELIPVDTLNSLFGSEVLLGGTSASVADVVSLGTSVNESQFYYNTSLARWVKTSGPTTDRGDTRIPPEGTIAITRRGPALSLQLAGRVPVTQVNMQVLNTGSTFTHTGFPTDVTLGDLALQNRVDGWLVSTSAKTADVLGVATSGGSWSYFFYNGSFWRRTTGPNINRNSTIIPAGAALRLVRRSPGAGTATYTRALPYDLE